jgi:hypothetical protein
MLDRSFAQPFAVRLSQKVGRRTTRINGPALNALISKPTRPPAPLHAIVLSRSCLLRSDLEYWSSVVRISKAEQPSE